MKTIGERIAELRKEKGMTQEALGETIGVSAQTVSKWENGNTAPDIYLLPVLAEVFGVTIDSLFSAGGETEYPVSRDGWEQIPETLYDGFFRSYFRIWNSWNPSGRSKTPEDVRQYFVDHPEAQSGFSSDERGIVYFNGEIGLVWLSRPEDTARLLEDDAVTGLFADLCDPVFLEVLRFFAEVNPSTFTRFTAASFAKRAGLTPEQTERALTLCEKHSLMVPEKIDSGEEEPLVVWTVAHAPKIRFVLGPMLALAKRFAEFKNHWWCLRG